MKKELKEILGLGLIMAKTNFKLKNEGTFLGILWYLITPLITFLLLLGIFEDRLGQNIPNYPLYLLLGILIFNYVNRIASESIRLLKQNNEIIKSINFRKEALVINVLFTNLFMHFFEIIILILFLIFFKISIISMILYPLILFIISTFALGLGLFLSSIEIYFVDLKNLWGFFSKAIWFLTPIFYTIGGQTKLRILNYLNPMYYLITFARDIIIYSKLPSNEILFGTFFFTAFFIILGTILFRKLNKKFAELV